MPGVVPGFPLHCLSCCLSPNAPCRKALPALRPALPHLSGNHRAVAALSPWQGGDRADTSWISYWNFLWPLLWLRLGFKRKSSAVHCAQRVSMEVTGSRPGLSVLHRICSSGISQTETRIDPSLESLRRKLIQSLAKQGAEKCSGINPVSFPPAPAAELLQAHFPERISYLQKLHSARCPTPP